MSSLHLAPTLAVLAALAVAQPCAATPTDTVLAAALADFDRASGGQPAAIEPAARALQALSSASPADPVLRAYAGAATSMMATTTMLPWRKIGLVEDGLALIDKALAQLTPAHEAPGARGIPPGLEVRFVAANTFLALPGFFNRGPRGEQLLETVQRHPQLERAPAAFRGAVWMFAAGRAAKAGRREEARRLLERVIAADAPQASAARARLREL